MKIYTSYFYQIRNFKPNMIPVSTAISDPFWYRPPAGKEYYIEGPIKFKERGFHFCKNLEDVFRYYNGFDENTVICEVEGFGEIDTYNDE